MTKVPLLCGLLLQCAPSPTSAQQIGSGPANQIQNGLRQKQALKINEAIYQANGFGNTFMITTPDGNVIVDTSSPALAKHHVDLLKAVNGGPVKYIILTHAHGDHTGGAALWKEPGTQILSQKNAVAFRAYQRRLGGFFATRNAAQFGLAATPPNTGAGIRAPIPDPTILFDEEYRFTLGGVEFNVFHTPGETPDHLTVWVPKYKAAFIGDNYYESFPNMYTLRGTEPRWPLEYISSLNKVMQLKPEILLPSHGRVIEGNAEIGRRLTQYRDAIQYVHDEVVKGMNAGKDVFTLMRDVRLPAALEVGEGYGKLTWSVRGIYEGYAGWFDMNPATMYDVPASSVHSDITRLAGGPERLAKLAVEQVQQGRNVEALHVTAMALAADPHNRPALEARLLALAALRELSHNTNEQGWLDYSIRQTQRQLNP